MFKATHGRKRETVGGAGDVSRVTRVRTGHSWPELARSLKSQRARIGLEGECYNRGGLKLTMRAGTAGRKRKERKERVKGDAILPRTI